MKGIFRFLVCFWGACAGMSFAESIPIRSNVDTPATIACVHERMVMDGVGVLFPSETKALVPGGIVTFGSSNDAWPPMFLFGLVARENDDITAYPFTVELDDASGVAIFRNANGVCFYEVTPTSPSAAAWFRIRLGIPDSGLIPPYRELSHLVSEWVLVHEDEVETFVENRNVQNRRVEKVQRFRVAKFQSREAEGLAFTEFEITDSEPPEYVFTVAWNGDAVATNDVLDLFGAPALTTNEWYPLASIAATNGSPFVLTLSETNFPWYVPPVECPRDGCSCPACISVVITNYSGSAFDPFSGNITMTVVTNTVCNCPGGSPSGFFRLFRRADSDADGLLDAEEVLLHGTNPLLSDSDGDGLNDVEELDIGTNPLLVDTDGDGLNDLAESGTISSNEYQWFDAGSSTNLLLSHEDVDGIWTFSLSSPIIYDGLPHDRIAIDTNGLVFILKPGEEVTNCFPVVQPLSTWNENPAHIAVAALWDSLQSNSESALRFFESGDLSIVEFNDFLVPPISRPRGLLMVQASRRASFQIVLPRTIEDTIDVYYREIPNGGISVGAVVGVQNRDRGYFLLPNGRCTLPTPDDPNVVPASGRGFRYHLGIGTDPTNPDTDGDGLPDGVEVDLGSNPLNIDTDQDGISDDIEILAGTDPTDPCDKIGYQAGAVVGNGGQGVPVQFGQTFLIAKNTSALVGIWVATEEYPTYTQQSSEYNDILTWELSTNSVVVQAGTTNVNALHAQFVSSRREHHSVPGMLITKPPVDIAWYFLSAPDDADLTVALEFEVINISDGELPSTMMAAIYPLRVVQTNWPDSTTATDFGNRHSKRIVQNGIAYVTGEPAAPEIKAVFQNLPSFVELGWALELKTERIERNLADDRRIPNTGYIIKPGNEEWNITEGLNEIVGGAAILSIRKENHIIGCAEFVIRGKNPMDADVEQFISNEFAEEFVPYAKYIVRHESWDTRSISRHFIYNQFNNLNTSESYREKVNLGRVGDVYGWGMAQITDSAWANRTDVVWNWKTNLLAMQSILFAKQADHNRFIDYFRDSYGSSPNWEEPPASHTINHLSLSAEAWGTMTLFNGAGGLPQSSVPTHFQTFRSPWTFNAERGIWTLWQNQYGYSQDVDDKSVYQTRE